MRGFAFPTAVTIMLLSAIPSTIIMLFPGNIHGTRECHVSYHTALYSVVLEVAQKKLVAHKCVETSSAADFDHKTCAVSRISTNVIFYADGPYLFS
jgi:hypothetical protein